MAESTAFLDDPTMPAFPKPPHWQELDEDHPYLSATLIRKDRKLYAYLSDPFCKALDRFDGPLWWITLAYTMGFVQAAVLIITLVWLTY